MAGTVLRQIRSAVVIAAGAVIALAGVSAQAQSSIQNGTPAESKGGAATASTYARDKIETVNLANGNLSMSIPLVTIVGRGSAAFTLSLSYNSKLWSGEHWTEEVPQSWRDQNAGPEIVHHYAARFNESVLEQLNSVSPGAGWAISKGPWVKGRLVRIDPITCAEDSSYRQEIGCYKYVLTKTWLVLPDGSEVEMRDSLTEGAPYLLPTPMSSQADRDRGRVWHSVDGSNITMVNDATGGGYWVFMADGSRIRSANNQTKIFDPQGNFLTIDYDVPSLGAVTYTDQLGRQTILSGGASGVTITVKGYNGVSDRVININTGVIGALNASQVAENLRADFRSLPRPFTSGDALRSYSQGYDDHTINSSHTDLFNGSEGGENIDEAGAVTSISLLDGRSFRFRYNPYGEVAEVVYPGGGVSRIDYDGFHTTVCEAPTIFNDVLNRKVVKRKLLTDGINVHATWTYLVGVGTAEGGSYPYTLVEARAGDNNPSGQLLLSEKHFFKALDAEYKTCPGAGAATNGTLNEKWENAKEFRVERQTGTGTQVTHTEWEQRTPVVWGNDPGLSYNSYAAQHQQEQPSNDPRVKYEDTILENGRMKRVEHSYDQFNNVISTKEYDFGTEGSPGQPLRETVREYAGSGANLTVNGYCYSNLNPTDTTCGSGIASDLNSIIYRRHVLLSETVYEIINGTQSVQRAQTKYEYDDFSSDSNHAAVAQNSGMIKYDGSRFSSFTGTHEPRGLVTAVKRWLEGTGAGATFITSYSRYDNAGNVVWVKDPKGNVSTVSYADDFGDGSSPGGTTAGSAGPTFAFATYAKNAANHEVWTQYDYTRGVATGVKDPNGVITRTEYDNIGRPFKITAALGLQGLQTVAETTYPTASANFSTASRQLDVQAGTTRWMASKVEYDGFDRPVSSYASEDGQHASSANFTIKTETVYDALGRAYQGSNPYRPNQNESPIYTTTAFDLAGRVKSVTTPDGAAVNTFYDSTRVLVRDQAGKERISETDALGRLAEVWEVAPADGSTEAVTFPGRSEVVAGYKTTYGYDALGNLTNVSQRKGAAGTLQTRSFSYDHLSRLTSATNPESGTINYQYDAAGNLILKIDPRTRQGSGTLPNCSVPYTGSNVATCYEYDSLGRIQSRKYNDGTPDVTYTYDAAGVANSKGRLTSVSNSVSLTNYGEFDALGRVKQSSQETDGQIYSMSYGYDLAGNMISQTYPSGRVVTTAFDGAGRVAGLSGQKTGEANKTYASQFNYTAHGAVKKLKLGNDLWEQTIYNSRLQPQLIGLGTTAYKEGNDLQPQDLNRFRVDYSYGTTDNNGNVLQQTISVPNASGTYVAQMTQNYEYDALNRLKSATETAGTSQSWKQTFVYDRYGNRRFKADETSFPAIDQTNENSTNPAISELNNRLSGTGYRYDAAGNLECDPAHPCAPTTEAPYFEYDGENKQVRSGGGSSSGGTDYKYDGDGRRVKKITGTGQLTTVFVYNAAGQLVAEYDSAAPSGTGGTSYLTSDSLGTPRVITDTNGSVKVRHDYLPFGEEIGAGVGGRTQSQGYSQFDGVRQRYTGAERDDETGLDFMQARYYASTQGRFTSADPINTVIAERAVDPQQLNLYSYVRNNPLKFVDSTGMKIDPSRLNKDQRKQWDEIVKLANAKDELGDYVNPELHATYQRLEEDKRTFFIEDHSFGDKSGTIGEFTVTKFGANDFTEAVIQLDFNKVKNLSGPQDVEMLVPGFKKFEGLFEMKNEVVLRLAELFGHEGTHGVVALNDPAEAVKLQRILNDRDAALNNLPKGTKFPYPPDVMQKMEAATKGLIPTERFAQQTEQRINRELNPKLRGVKCKK